MSKRETLLKAFKSNLGEWVCGYCNSESNQPAATFREIKKMGYNFEEFAPNRWGKDMYCSNCKMNRTHYKLLSLEPKFDTKERIYISNLQRKRIIKIFDCKDAITNAHISSVPEIDHKIPWTRLDKDIDVEKLSDNQIREHFQLLTREHNLLKDRACDLCKRTNTRPKYLDFSFWYKGCSEYEGICEGCGWYDPVEWRRYVKKIIEK